MKLKNLHVQSHLLTFSFCFLLNKALQENCEKEIPYTITDNNQISKYFQKKRNKVRKEEAANAAVNGATGYCNAQRHCSTNGNKY